MLLRYPSFAGRVENRKCYRSLKLFNFFKNILQFTIEVVGLYKVCVAIGIGDDRGSQAVHSVCSNRGLVTIEVVGLYTVCVAIGDW